MLSFSKKGVIFHLVPLDTNEYANLQQKNLWNVSNFGYFIKSQEKGTRSYFKSATYKLNG